MASRIASNDVHGVQPDQGLTRGNDWAGRLFGRGLHRGDRLLGYLFLLPSAVLITILVLYPFSQVIFLGFFDKDTLSDDMTWVGLDNYRAFFEYPDLANAFKNTVVWTAGSVCLELIVGLVTALVLHQSLRLRTIARGIVLFSVPAANDRCRTHLEVHAERPGWHYQPRSTSAWPE
jgi:hypothetical protein